MYQTTTPTENGWYWVQSSAEGGWTMAYLDAEANPPRLRCFDKNGWSAEFVRADAGRWESKIGFGIRPRSWIGPLPLPANGGVAYFHADLYKNRNPGETLVMTHEDGKLGTITTTSIERRAE
jgi:hypothetical protein